MEATVVNYRGGRRTQKTHQMILHVEGSDSKEDAEELVGKDVEWTTPGGNKIKGEVTKTHGNKGNVVARFEKGLPGQALGTKAEIK